MEKNNYRDWLDLPVELMESIMQRIGWYDVLMGAKNVCKTWHKICKGLSEWQVIEIRQVRVSNNVQIGEEWGYLEKVSIFFGEHAIEIEFICGINETVELKCGIEGVELGMKLAMHVIDLSSGELLDLCIHGFGCNHLLEFISHRSSQLRRLRLQFCDVYSDDYSDDSFKPKPPRLHISNKGLIEMLRHLPLLEELQFPHTSIPTECIEVAGRCCPHLKSFTLNEKECYYWGRPLTNNAHALAIVRNMPKLRHLQLFGNRMTDRGLKAILNHCHFLEYLDLRECYFLYDALEEAKIPRNLRRRNLARELRQKIKLVRFPLDSTEDYEFKAEISDFYDYW
ncbi:hypothetical protein POM88_027366 [Heracleum sosnowskyi]|uniref:F-box domain-containing protein n=1 Tax=Heracleum sosnowskyi TaxID=360622 RepID=A0AAD8I9T6_9APIA|nr:hypothetical protein POM88_027366 [Heracleum sosnowskyi]